jgi:hypothetical protein
MEAVEDPATEHKKEASGTVAGDIEIGGIELNGRGGR